MSLIICGGGGHAREVALVAHEVGVEIGGFFVEPEWAQQASIVAALVLTSWDRVRHVASEPTVFPGGVGDPVLKERFAEDARAAGLNLSDPLVHPSAILGEVGLGEGSFMGAYAVATVNVTVGRHVTLNRGVNLSHDVVVGDYATVSPGVHVAGNVRIGRGAFIGIGVSIGPGVEIGERAVVGGGSFVMRDVVSGARVGGVPARPV